MRGNNDNFIMLPTVDFCFKELMQNEKVRNAFIAALLKQKTENIKETILLPTILEKKSIDDKQGILDVRVLWRDGIQIDMEMQVAYFAYWDKRALFYLSKMFASQLKQGDSYDKLKKCIHVSILDFIHFPDDDEFYRVIHFHEDESFRLYTDLLELQILELKKIPEEIQRGDDIINWMQFFNGRNRKELEQMAQKNEHMKIAYDTLLELSADEQKRLEYEAREKALRDYNSQMESSLQIGYERGMKQGIEKVIKITRLSHQGMSAQEISAACDMSLAETEKILKELCVIG